MVKNKFRPFVLTSQLRLHPALMAASFLARRGWATTLCNTLTILQAEIAGPTAYAYYLMQREYFVQISSSWKHWILFDTTKLSATELPTEWRFKTSWINTHSITSNIRIRNICLFTFSKVPGDGPKSPMLMVWKLHTDQGPIPQYPKHLPGLLGNPQLWDISTTLRASRVCLQPGG